MPWFSDCQCTNSRAGWTESEGGFRIVGMNNHPILYLGDDNVDGAAAYLAGVMTHFGLKYEHRPSDRPLDIEVLAGRWSLIVISDYPASNISPDIMAGLVEMVSQGTGFLMIGGWGSFQGQDGKYNGTLLGNILPVTIDEKDDRVNSAGPCLISIHNGRGNHPIVGGLPFETDTPGIGGFNRLTAADDGEVILESRVYRAAAAPSGLHQLDPFPGSDPLLVVGSHGKGRTCAWATDVAPHWVGGLVDWGPERVEARGHGDAGSVEVGNLYAEFFKRILVWTSRAE